MSHQPEVKPAPTPASPQATPVVPVVAAPVVPLANTSVAPVVAEPAKKV